MCTLISLDQGCECVVKYLKSLFILLLLVRGNTRAVRVYIYCWVWKLAWKHHHSFLWLTSLPVCFSHVLHGCAFVHAKYLIVIYWSHVELTCSLSHLKGLDSRYGRSVAFIRAPMPRCLELRQYYSIDWRLWITQFPSCAKSGFLNKIASLILVHGLTVETISFVGRWIWKPVKLRCHWFKRYGE